MKYLNTNNLINKLSLFYLTTVMAFLILLLHTKKGLINGQLELIHKNDFSAEAVFALNQKFGYDDTK